MLYLVSCKMEIGRTMKDVALCKDCHWEYTTVYCTIFCLAEEKLWFIPTNIVKLVSSGPAISNLITSWNLNTHATTLLLSIRKDILRHEKE